MPKFFTKSYMLKHAKKHSQNSANVAWREVVEGTIPVSEVVCPSQVMSCDTGATEQVVCLYKQFYLKAADLIICNIVCSQNAA